MNILQRDIYIWRSALHRHCQVKLEGTYSLILWDLSTGGTSVNGTYKTYWHCVKSRTVGAPAGRPELSHARWRIVLDLPMWVGYWRRQDSGGGSGTGWGKIEQWVTVEREGWVQEECSGSGGFQILASHLDPIPWCIGE